MIFIDSRKWHLNWSSRDVVGVVRLRVLNFQWFYQVLSISQNLKSFTCNSNVLIWMKSSREGPKQHHSNTLNKLIQDLIKYLCKHTIRLGWIVQPMLKFYNEEYIFGMTSNPSKEWRIADREVLHMVGNQVCHSHKPTTLHEMFGKYLERTEWNSNVYWPPIPWSVNPFLQDRYSIFVNVHLKW